MSAGRSWHRRRRMLLQDEKSFGHAADGDNAALEERIVTPCPFEAWLVGTDRMRVEEPDLLGMQAIGDVEDAQAADVVRLIHRIADQPEVVVGSFVLRDVLA